LARHPTLRNRIVTILRLHHAQITIPVGHDDAARDFYCNVLGLPEIDKPASLRDRGGFWLQVSDVQVHVGTEDGADRNATKAHLAYQVDNLQTWRERLSASGITLLDAIPIPGYDRFEFRDPFDNRVELIQPVYG
jgi:catechol 2,3-dioxygenase-like lactoylglutathione lyase family enzyme